MLKQTERETVILFVTGANVPYMYSQVHFYELMYTALTECRSAYAQRASIMNAKWSKSVAILSPFHRRLSSNPLTEGP